MPRIPDDLASSIVYSSGLPDLTRQLENILEILADAHNNSINSQEQGLVISTTMTNAILSTRGVGILLLLPTRSDGPSLIAACCKPNETEPATINTLCSQPSKDNQNYQVQWNGNQNLQVSVSGGDIQPVRVLWIGS